MQNGNICLIKNFSKWIYVALFVVLVDHSSSVGLNEVILSTRSEGGFLEFPVNLDHCVSLQENGITGKLISVAPICVEVHKEGDCSGDYITLRPDVPALDRLFVWNLNGKRSWIESVGPKAVSPCRFKCNETNIEHYTPNKMMEVALYSQRAFEGVSRNVTVKDCKVIPKALRNMVMSLKTDGSYCIELYERRDCTGESIQVPRNTPSELTGDLGEWGFSRKTKAVSFCGYNCPNSDQRQRELEDYPELFFPQVGITLYTEIYFQGKQEYMNLTEGTCSNLTEHWGNTMEIMSIQLNANCIDLFESQGCNKDLGKSFHLNNLEQSQNLIAAGWKGVIKSIALCRPVKVEIPKPNYFLVFCLLAFSIFYVTVIIAFILWRRKAKKLLKNSNAENGDETVFLTPDSESLHLEAERVAPILKRTNSNWPLWFNVGSAKKNFVGRESELNELGEIYTLPIYKIVLISGQGGNGKTELIKRFAEQVQKGNGNCTWFSGDSGESLHQSLINLALQIGIPTTNEQGEIRETPELFEDLVTLVSANKESTSWLVIFDNVNTSHPDLLACLQQLSETESSMTILISRNVTLAKEDWQLISLDKWESADAIQFVKTSLRIDTNLEDDLINELCAKLQNHALAVELAMAYIILQQKQNSSERNPYSISDYVGEIEQRERKTSEILHQKLGKTSHDFAKTTFVTVDVTISKLKKTHEGLSSLSCEILHKIAYLDPNSIPLEIVNKIVKGKEIMVRKAVELLKDYSLVKLERDVISIHRLVQKVIRIRLKSSNDSATILTSIIKAYENFQKFERSEVRHVLSVWKYSSKYDKIIKEFPQVGMEIFKTLSHFGLVSELYTFATWNLTRFEEFFGEDHMETLKMRGNLALALKGKGELEKPRAILEELWEKQKLILGEENEWTLRTSNNLAVVLYELGRFEEAKNLYRKVYENSLSENYPEEISAKEHMGVGDSDLYPTLRMLKKALKWQEREMDKYHEETVQTRHNIGVCLFNKGNYSEAKEIFENIKELQRVDLGEEHPHTLTSLHWLGKIEAQLVGGRDKSLNILREVLNIRKKVLGANHPHTLGTQKLVNRIQNGGVEVEKRISKMSTFL